MAVRASAKGGEYRRRKGGSLPGLIVIGVAIIVAAFLLSRKPAAVEQKVATPAIVAEFDTVMVPVPIEPIPAGARVRDVQFKNIPYPKHQLPEGAVLSLQNLGDTYTVSALPANLPLFRKNLSTNAAASNPVMEKIPPGMRAITIRVDATSSVEGWAGSGTIVDVILVEKDRSTVVAERVKILSAERSVSPVESGSAPNVPSTVTLLVTQDQALAINTAIPLGRIAFALRSAQDEEGWSSTSYTADRLKGGSAGKRTSQVQGYVSIGGSDGSSEERSSFALSDGKWVKTEVIPEGFLVAEESRKKAASK